MKKKTLYYMLPLIILVWGFVFYQLFSYFFSSPNYAKGTVEQTINIEKIKQDTFSIVANYRDPFLGKKVTTSRRNTASRTSQKSIVRSSRTNVKPQRKMEQPWPSIQYQGMIKNNNANRRVGILKIDGKEFLVKEGQVIKEVKVMSINKQEVELGFQKEKKRIIKQN